MSTVHPFMYLPDVLAFAKEKPDNLWFRPKGVKYDAYCIREGRVCVAVGHGREIPITTDVELLMREWELVSPDTVLNELDALMDQLRK